MQRFVRCPRGPRLTLAVSLIGGVAVAACGEEIVLPPPPPMVASVVVTSALRPTGEPGTDTLTALESVQLTATARDAAGSPVAEVTFTWESSDDAVATVDATGLVTGVAPGTVVVTATAGGQSGTADMVVIAGPPGRAFHSMAYDAESDRVILYGGETDNNTWAYDLDANSWTDMKPATSPDARGSHAMAYDAQSDRVILFGGLLVDLVEASDTWAYDFNTNSWTDMNPTSSPIARYGHRMVYDARSDRIILFAGLSGPGGGNHIHQDETWAYDFDTNAWTQLGPVPRPRGGICFALAYDAESGRVIHFGGDSHTVVDNADTWAYDFNTNTWTDMNPAARPGAQTYMAMAYHAGSDRVILFGGTGGSETWAYDFNRNVWTNMNSVVHPSGRWAHAMAYDAGSDRVILFGGFEGFEPIRSETWAYDFNTNTWTKMQ